MDRSAGKEQGQGLPIWLCGWTVVTHVGALHLHCQEDDVKFKKRRRRLALIVYLQFLKLIKDHCAYRHSTCNPAVGFAINFLVWRWVYSWHMHVIDL